MYLTSPYLLDGNDVVEQAHHTINNVIRAILLEDPCLQWPDVLPAVQLILNAALHSTHHYTPYHVIVGGPPGCL